MLKNRKRIFASLLCFVLLTALFMSVLAGCGKKKEPPLTAVFA